MKKIILVYMLSTLLIVSCEEDTLPDGLIGKWEWISSSGGIAGITETPESTGNNIEIVFTANSTFMMYRNDSLIVERKYDIIEAKSILNHKLTKMISFDDDQFRKSFLVTPEELYLADEVYDGFTYRYKRIE